MSPKYYLALFNRASWQEFLYDGGKVYGTTGTQRNRAKKIHNGDFLICYITGISEFVGILEIKSELFRLLLKNVRAVLYVSRFARLMPFG